MKKSRSRKLPTCHSELASESSPKNIFAKKSLGQNFLFDREILAQIVDCADLSRNDTVLEIGPGLGTLTAEILSRNVKVFAVEFDEILAKNLRANIMKIFRQTPDLSFADSISESSNNSRKTPAPIRATDHVIAGAANQSRKIDNNSRKNSTKNNENIVAKNLTIFHEDFLKFRLAKLPPNYKIIANIPYNLTSPIIEKILRAHPQPAVAILLIQKEVAERIVAQPGDLSLLAIKTQLFANANLGIKIPPEKFIPAPKVDSQIVILIPRKENLLTEFSQKNNLKNDDFAKLFWRILNAGFAQKRKKLANNLMNNFHFQKPEIAQLFAKTNLNLNARAQDISIENWLNLAKNIAQL